MKLKKYICCIIVLILTLSVGMNYVKADNWFYYKKHKTVAEEKKEKMKEGTPYTECYYMSPEGAKKTLKLSARFFWGSFATTDKDLRYGSSIAINNYAGKLSTTSTSIENWSRSYKKGSYKGFAGPQGGANSCTTSNVCFGYFYTFDQIKSMTSGTCPKYIVVELNYTSGDEYFGYATNDISLATQAANSKTKKTSYAYASNYNEQGDQITKEMYMSSFVVVGNDSIDDVELKCEEIFTDDLKEIINEVLQYVRIIVPILIILLGTIDLSKAVIASKEDVIKKAQIDFIKRIIIGVAIFFVPALVDVVMDLGNIVWEDLGYTTCNFQ